MNHASRKKLYCYVDESGQDTGGRIFVVGVVVLQEELENYFSFQLTKILKQPTEQKELKKHEIVFSKNLLRAGKL